MQKWDYLTVVAGDFFHLSGNLIEHGAAGWELVTVLLQDGGWLLIFKRPSPESPC